MLEVGAVELPVKTATCDDVQEIGKFATLNSDLNDKDLLRNYNDVNAKFHLQIVKATHNEFLIKMFNQVFSQLSRVLYKDLINTSDIEEVYKEHLEIYHAIENKDVIKARDFVS
jgi:DNA-binding FadR family transcriptional regulator